MEEYKPATGRTIPYDGKIYRFIGKYWAEVNPATDKAGRIAKKEIGAILTSLAQAKEIEYEGKRYRWLGRQWAVVNPTTNKAGQMVKKELGVLLTQLSKPPGLPMVIQPQNLAIIQDQNALVPQGSLTTTDASFDDVKPIDVNWSSLKDAAKTKAQAPSQNGKSRGKGGGNDKGIFTKIVDNVFAEMFPTLNKIFDMFETKDREEKENEKIRHRNSAFVSSSFSGMSSRLEETNRLLTASVHSQEYTLELLQKILDSSGGNGSPTIPNVGSGGMLKTLGALAGGFFAHEMVKDESKAGNSIIGSFINENIPGAATVDDWVYRTTGGLVGTSMDDPRYSRNKNENATPTSKPQPTTSNKNKNATPTSKPQPTTSKTTRLIANEPVDMQNGLSEKQYNVMRSIGAGITEIYPPEIVKLYNDQTAELQSYTGKSKNDVKRFKEEHGEPTVFKPEDATNRVRHFTLPTNYKDEAVNKQYQSYQNEVESSTSAYWNDRKKKQSGTATPAPSTTPNQVSPAVQAAQNAASVEKPKLADQNIITLKAKEILLSADKFILQKKTGVSANMESLQSKGTQQPSGAAPQAPSAGGGDNITAGTGDTASPSGTPSTPGGGGPAAEQVQAGSMTTIKTGSGKSVQVGEKYAPQFQGFINDLEKTGYKISDIGGFADRQNVNDPSKKSMHAYGAAIDINPDANPNNSTKTDMPKETAEIAKKWGLGWGMNWSSVKDPMHFSAAPQEGGSTPTATADANKTETSGDGAKGTETGSAATPTATAAASPVAPPISTGAGIYKASAQNEQSVREAAKPVVNISQPPPESPPPETIGAVQPPISSTEPGNVEPPDSRMRYKKLFLMAV